MPERHRSQLNPDVPGALRRNQSLETTAPVGPASLLAVPPRSRLSSAIRQQEKSIYDKN